MFESIKRNRFIVNPDEKTKEMLKSRCSIADDEEILLVLDDSLFKNLKKFVVFTNKMIHWNYGDVLLIDDTPNIKVDAAMPGCIETKRFSAASIFVDSKNGLNTVFILDEHTTIIIPLRHFPSGDSLQYAFYHYMTNYSGGYAPSHKNKIIYKKALANFRRKKENIVHRIFDIVNSLIIICLLVNLIAPFFPKIKVFLPGSEKIMLASIIFKLAGFVIGSRKSFYAYAVLVAITSGILVFPNLLSLTVQELNFVYAGYCALTALFTIVDFDKASRFTIILLAILSVILLILKSFAFLL